MTRSVLAYLCRYNFKREFGLNKVFGELTFDVGWHVKKPVNIELWGKSYPIKVTAESYYEEDSITKEQEEAYASFTENKAVKQQRVEALLLEYYKENPLENLYHQESLEYCDVNIAEFKINIKQQLPNVLTPRILVIDDEGTCALLFDDKIDPDNGIAVILSPTEEVMTQDEYL